LGGFVVYPDGKVCISILHEAKEDQFNEQEHISMKWRPILGVNGVERKMLYYFLTSIHMSVLC